ncbi:MAG: hypothetical protein H6719_16110 [Sandaracinaceae bacterium]|nr:hypothetical protein [Sandaracinaceae bacterium]
MIELAVTCTACGAGAVHEVGAVLLDHDALEGADDAEAWTRAVYVAMSLTCPSCGAVDQHRVVPESGRALEVDGQIVREGCAALSDGTVIHTPTEGITLLEARASAAPNDPLGWRALGNFAMRAGQSERALAAWRRGAELDGELECALAIAVDAVARSSEHAADLVARAAERLVFAAPQRRPLQSAHVAELVRKLGAPLVLVLDGTRVDPTGVRDWSGFGERLATAREIQATRP